MVFKKFVQALTRLPTQPTKLRNSSLAFSCTNILVCNLETAEEMAQPGGTLCLSLRNAYVRIHVRTHVQLVEHFEVEHRTSQC